MKKFFIVSVILVLTSCTTAKTTLQHPKTKQLATCGGSVSGSLMGGAIGHEIQKDHDNECVAKYKKQGYKVIEVNE